MITKYLKTATAKQSFLTSSATILNGALGVLFYILLARVLGPSTFGVFIIAVTVLAMTADIANLGTDTGLIRFIGKYLLGNRKKALQFLKIGLQIKLAVWFLVMIVGWFLLPMLANDFFTKPELLVPLRLSLFGVGGAMLFSFVTSAIQGYQRYITWSLLNILLNSLRLILVGLLAALVILNITNSLIIYIGVPFLGFLIGIVLLPSFLNVKVERGVKQEFFHYNKWVALFVVLAALSNRVDIFLVGKFLSNKDAGIYGAANQLGAVVPQIIFAIAAVVAPKLASFRTDEQAIVYLKKLQLMVILLALIGLISIPFAIFLIPAFFGNAYIESIPIFITIFIAQLIFLISLPVHQSVFYYFSNPKLFVWIALVHLILMILLGFYLIPIMGLMGIAVAVLIGNISNFLIPTIWVVFKFKKGFQGNG